MLATSHMSKAEHLYFQKDAILCTPRAAGSSREALRQQGPQTAKPSCCAKLRAGGDLKQSPHNSGPQAVQHGPNHRRPAGLISLRGVRLSSAVGVWQQAGRAPSWSSHGSSSGSHPGAWLEERRNLNSALTCLHGDSQESQQMSLCPGSTRWWQGVRGPPQRKPHPTERSRESSQDHLTCGVTALRLQPACLYRNTE